MKTNCSNIVFLVEEIVVFFCILPDGFIKRAAFHDQMLVPQAGLSGL